MKMEECILDMDLTRSTKDNLDSIFRYIHSLKGSPVAMLLNDMATLSHSLEEFFG